jgi:hypothetical protein
MIVPVQAKVGAWQPLTPRGAAAFAGAPLRRLLLIQLAAAAVAAMVVAWFLQVAWFPTIRAAARQLPAHGEIRGGRLLDWAGESPRVLADGRFLAFAVDLDHGGSVRSPAHFQVEFGRTDIRCYSLLGFVACPYPRGYLIAFNRPEVEPWWGAWEPAITWISAILVAAGLPAGWALLATLYAPAAWFIGFFNNRKLDLAESWKLAGAALLPGALLMIAGIVGYGAGVLDLVGFGVIAGVHVVTGWIYVLISPLFAPKLPLAVAAQSNPFAAPPPENLPASSAEGPQDPPASRPGPGPER